MLAATRNSANHSAAEEGHLIMGLVAGDDNRGTNAVCARLERTSHKKKLRRTMDASGACEQAERDEAWSEVVAAIRGATSLLVRRLLTQSLRC